MSNQINFLSLLFIFVYLSVLSRNCYADYSRQQVDKNVVMFIFGDSLFDPGNNNNLNISVGTKANRWPYGETFFKFPTGRFCDGRVIADFIAEYAKLPLWKPFLQTEANEQFFNGANFASGGSGVLPQTNTGTIDLKTQLNFLKVVANQLRQELDPEEVTKMLMEAVYLFSTGGNDYITYGVEYPNATESEQEEFVKIVIGNLTDIIKDIYEMGGQKFVFQNVAPLGCIPFVKQLGGVTGDTCDELMQAYARLHNDALIEAVESLASQLQGFKYLIFDYYTSLYNIITNPSQYGFQVSDVACCSGPSYCGIPPYELCSDVGDYVFFDPAHPSEKVNIQLSNLLWNGEPPVVKPINMKQFLMLDIESNLLSEEI